jgi:hypothetical protein
VDRVCASSQGGVDQQIAAEVGVRWRRTGQPDRCVCLADVRAVRVCIGEHRDGVQSQIAAGTKDPASYLGPVGDEDAADLAVRAISVLQAQIITASDRTRVVIPISDPSVNRIGGLRVKSYVAGPLMIEWTVVTVNAGCPAGSAAPLLPSKYRLVSSRLVASCRDVRVRVRACNMCMCMCMCVCLSVCLSVRR